MVARKKPYFGLTGGWLSFWVAVRPFIPVLIGFKPVDWPELTCVLWSRWHAEEEMQRRAKGVFPKGPRMRAMRNIWTD
jgi:hypothetical protein